ncbi:MAG: fimbrillin family protein, partial [Paraprevotella sp.]|nr:fimbrillin family protein [Paraprevotella sp.]
YDGTIDATEGDATKSPDYTNNFKVAYLADAEFIYKNDVNAWGGRTAYYWPTNGSLVFAGYSKPATGEVGTSRSYDFANNKMTFTGYTQSELTSNTFDLLWFGRTAESYNYRNASTAVSVQFKHALSWITIKVVGDATSTSSANPWKITSVVLNQVNTVGDAELIDGTTPTISWKNHATPEDMAIYSGSKELTTTATTIETTANGTVVIPQKPLSLTVNYEYNTPANVLIKESKTVSLKLTTSEEDTNNVWKGGVHYTYTLTFKANEILVAPKVTTWENGANTGVTVE